MLLYRGRWLVLLLALLIVSASTLFGTSVFGRLTSGGFTDPASESSRATDLLNAKLANSSADVLMLLQNSTLVATDPAFTQAATQLLSTLQARSEVYSLSSYYSTHNAGLISRDGHETLVLLHLKATNETDKEQAYKALQPFITSSLLHIQVGGTVPVSIAINQQVSADLERAELITFPILALLLLFVFGGLVAAGLPLLIGGIAILGAFAVLRLLTNVTDISVFAINVVTMLGLGLAIDYALFIVTRFREELAIPGQEVQTALTRTMASAGRTVIFSALTVSTSLLSLLLFPQVFLRSIGVGAIATILVVMLMALTILPALLALLGRRVNALSFRRFFRRSVSVSQQTEHHGAWYRLSETVMRWPVPVALAVLALLLTLGWPFLHITFATSDIRVLPVTQETRVVNDHLSHDFAQQGNAQITIAITTPGDALTANNLASLDGYVRQLQELPGVQHVTSLVSVDPALTLADYQQLYAHLNLSPSLTMAAHQLANGDVTSVTMAIQPVDHSAAAETLVRQVRALHAPGGLTPLVTGITASQIDLLSSLSAKLPYALLIIAISVFVLLFLMTGSLIMPLKAILLNILSLAATFGGLVWIFQDGHLQTLLNFQSLGSIDATQPVLIFAIAFGLSMDYEVFLLSRIKERFDATGDNRQAVSSGLQRTGWLITSAAVLLAIVLGAFGTSKIIFIQEIGIGLAIAVIMDATLIRMLLVPATMRLLGNLNWWSPRPLHQLWERIGLSESLPEIRPVTSTADLTGESEEAEVSSRI
jgi:RND superfamily putative drug exporter